MPTHKDAFTTAKILNDNHLSAHICHSLKEVCDEMDIGAGAAILPEEIILSDTSDVLKKTLENAPSWSDFPILVLTPAGKDSPCTIRALESIGHMMLMKRPVQIAELLSAIRSALRDRQRQYFLRQYLADLAKQSQALRASEAQFRQLANSIPQLAWIGDESGAMTWYNQRWYDYTGATYEEMKGWGWQSLHDPMELQRILITWKEALARGELWQEMFPLRRHDGEMRWQLTMAMPIRNEDGKVVRWFGTHTDITEQREALELANEANIAKSEFLANMSHEIRTPMNAVIGLATILSKSGGLTARQSEYVHTLQLAADSLLGLINDLLDISKIEARSIELENIAFSTRQLLSEIISIMSMRAKEKGLEFAVKGENNMHDVMIGDPTRLRQIIVNLCSNAIKFTEKGGVYICISHAPSSLAGMENVSIAITDTGIGIASDKQETIFEKFIQADSSINRKYGGTGLGLAITKTLTEIMGGRIDIDSKPGVGSTFTVTVPLKVAGNAESTQAESRMPVKEQEYQVTQSRVLLVEDYEANVLVAGSYLELFGYCYDVAVNGVEAVERAKNGDYIAILMDVQMHGMNGFEATELIRAYEKQAGRKRVPIIGMTAHALMGDRERCIAAEMDDYLSKPYDPDELEQKLANYLKSATKPMVRIVSSVA